MSAQQLRSAGARLRPSHATWTAYDVGSQNLAVWNKFRGWTKAGQVSWWSAQCLPLTNRYCRLLPLLSLVISLKADIRPLSNCNFKLLKISTVLCYLCSTTLSRVFRPSEIRASRCFLPPSFFRTMQGLSRASCPAFS